METFDVVIVGYGPVGATLANLLGRCGISTLVLERESSIYHLPRAVHFDDEVMRVFQATGLAASIESITRGNPGMRFVDTEGRLLLDWPRPQTVSPQGWRTSYRFHQPDLEEILRRGVERYPVVTTRCDSEVLRFDEHSDRVSVQYRDRIGGQERTVNAAYVVGCDGARSIVREAISTELEDHGFRERWLVVDLILERPMPMLGDHSIQFCRPERPATYVRGPGHRRRWELTVLEHETDQHITRPEVVWSLLSQWVTPQDARIERAVVYTFDSVIARRWWRDRLLIAGDAAHQTPPFMGQGMCMGIRDVANLAWKLGLVVKGRATSDLLETYQSERHPHTRAYIETAVRLGGLINTCGTEDALRGAFKRSDGTARMESIKPALGPGLASSSHRFAGRLSHQPAMPDGRRVDDCAAYEPILLVDSASWHAVQPDVARRATDKGVTIITSETCPEAADYLRDLESVAVCIRPDRYILGTASNRDELVELVHLIPRSPTV